jgi:autotransporter-associated beta strand protein
MLDSSPVKTDQPPLTVVTAGLSAGATATVNTLIDAGTKGGFADSESINNLTPVAGAAASAKISIGTGATLAVGGNVTTTTRTGLVLPPGGGQGISIENINPGAPGTLSLLSPLAADSGTTTFNVAETPHANDLVIGTDIGRAVNSVERQRFTLSGSPNAGSYRLQGGPLTGPTTPIAFNATEDEIRSALARVLPAGALVVVARTGGTAPNFQYTVTFINLAASVPAMTVVPNSVTLINTDTGAPGAVSAPTITTAFNNPVDSIVLNSIGGSSRTVFSGNNSYIGSTTINSGILQAASNTALGSPAGDTTVSGPNSVLELAGANVVGEQLTLSLAAGSTSQVGVFDQASTIQIAPNNGADAVVRMGSGGLRAVSGNNSWTGPISLSSGATGNTFGVTTAGSSTLDISEVISASDGSNALFKQGPGTLIFSGTQSNSVTGTTFVQDGTLVLNKQGAATAIAGNLVIGDTVGGNDADR